jgi:hypothetical protein
MSGKAGGGRPVSTGPLRAPPRVGRSSHLRTSVVSSLCCRAVPCRAVPCRAVPCRAVPCRAVPCCAVPCRPGSVVLEAECRRSGRDGVSGARRRDGVRISQSRKKDAAGRTRVYTSGGTRVEMRWSMASGPASWRVRASKPSDGTRPDLGERSLFFRQGRRRRGVPRCGRLARQLG